MHAQKVDSILHRHQRWAMLSMHILPQNAIQVISRRNTKPKAVCRRAGRKIEKCATYRREVQRRKQALYMQDLPEVPGDKEGTTKDVRAQLLAVGPSAGGARADRLGRATDRQKLIIYHDEKAPENENGGSEEQNH